MANKIYKIDETSITWTDTTGDLVMTLNNLAAGAGRQGAVKDLGAGGTARSRHYRWRCIVQQDTAGVVGEIIRVYLKFGDGTYYDNDDGTGDIAVSAEDKLNNLTLIGILRVDEAVADVNISKSGSVLISSRYVMPVIWNETADNLQATNDINKFILTPDPDEIQ